LKLEKLHHRPLVLDALGDEIEAVAREQILEVFRGDLARAEFMPWDESVRPHLDELEAKLLETCEIEIERRHLIHREAEAEPGEILRLASSAGPAASTASSENSKMIWLARSL